MRGGREGGREGRGRGGWQDVELGLNQIRKFNIMYIFFVSAKVPRSVDSIHKN